MFRNRRELLTLKLVSLVNGLDNVTLITVDDSERAKSIKLKSRCRYSTLRDTFLIRLSRLINIYSAVPNHTSWARRQIIGQACRNDNDVEAISLNTD